MELNRITVAIRPRGHWEAIDLGFSAARACWRPLYAAWFATVLPVALVINLLCLERLWLAPIILWWLKPLIDRVPLYVYSRALFDDIPGVRETIRALPGLLRVAPVSALTWRRFDLARSFNLPVWQLEGLDAAARRQRLKTLQKNTRGAAVWQIVACVHLEGVIYLALLGLLLLLVPQTVELDLMDLLLAEDAPLWFQALQNFIYFAAVSAIEPFYVAGGFALYLNRRIWLEGWDIEIAFRRMAQQLASLNGRIAA